TNRHSFPWRKIHFRLPQGLRPYSHRKRTSPLAQVERYNLKNCPRRGRPQCRVLQVASTGTLAHTVTVTASSVSSGSNVRRLEIEWSGIVRRGPTKILVPMLDFIGMSRSYC